MPLKSGSVSSEGLQFNMEATVHLLAKNLEVAVTSKEIVNQLVELRDAKQRLAHLREEFDRMRVELNTQEGLVDKLEAELRVEGLKQRGETR